jgi:hypothetical protein
VILTVGYVVDTVDVFCPVFVVQVLPLATDNLNRIFWEKESAGRAVGTGGEWTAMCDNLKGAGHYHRPPSPLPSF